MGIYDFTAPSISGEKVEFSQYKGKVLLIVNTASQCGFTPQYEGLEALYQRYQDKGLVVLGFPSNQFGQQEPGTAAEIQEFCKARFGVSFPLFAKDDVKGKKAQPLFTYLTEQQPGDDGSSEVKWNFTKFLVDRSGKVVSRREPEKTPEEMAAEIETLLG